jgi:DMSO/TMAO reductase YedYZ molybdopterin-dependent catalytic subunit
MSDHKQPDLQRFPQLKSRWDRRDFLKNAAVGTGLIALGGGLFRLLSDDASAQARAELRVDGRSRLPPGQRVIEKLKPMGGEEGSGDVKTFSLKVSGAVKKPFTVDYAALLKLPQVERASDVHCVTGWTVLGAVFKGVQVKALADLAELQDGVTHVIFEAAHGYTANVLLKEGIADNAMISYRMNGKPFALTHGAPVRGIIPDLYFWKSAKWITGIRFVKKDEPGYWETRGYHNHADPWKEERYS